MLQLVQQNRVDDTTCLNKIPIPDFEGRSNLAKSLSEVAFGTKDVWNQGS